MSISKLIAALKALGGGGGGGGGGVSDVKVNGTSVVTDGVANIPAASSSDLGVVKTNSLYGITIDGSTKILHIFPALSSEIKQGTEYYRPIVPSNLASSVFYGLAKAAGANMKDISGTTTGVYPETQKSKISDMLNAPETVTGSTPSITAKSGIKYVCGEVSTISITPPASGDCEVVFESGSTAAVLTVPNTVKWPSWFDPDNLDADTTYDIIISDAEYGMVALWT